MQQALKHIVSDVLCRTSIVRYQVKTEQKNSVTWKRCQYTKPAAVCSIRSSMCVCIRVPTNPDRKTPQHSPDSISFSTCRYIFFALSDEKKALKW